MCGVTLKTRDISRMQAPKAGDFLLHNELLLYKKEWLATSKGTYMDQVTEKKPNKINIIPTYHHTSFSAFLRTLRREMLQPFFPPPLVTCFVKSPPFVFRPPNSLNALFLFCWGCCLR